MANIGRAYGLSHELQTEIDMKYDPELEEKLVEWIIAQCGSEISKPEAGKAEFQSWLKDGYVSTGFHENKYSIILHIVQSGFRETCSSLCA